jgi:hypothetical protein
LHNQALWTISCSRFHHHAHWTLGWAFAYSNPLLIGDPNSWKVFNLEFSLGILDSSMIHLILSPWLICLTLDCSSSLILSSWSSCHHHLGMSSPSYIVAQCINTWISNPFASHTWQVVLNLLLH